MKNTKLSSNEATVRDILTEWVKLPREKRAQNGSRALHKIYGAMCSTDERADDGESLDALFEVRSIS